MKKRLPHRSWNLIATIFLFFAVVGKAELVAPGMARIHVLQELGEPASAMSRGGIEVLAYRNGAKITLVDGLVTEAVGLPPPSDRENAAETKIAAQPVISAEEQAIIAAEEAALSQQGAEQQVRIEQILSELENRHSNPRANLAPPKFNLVTFLAGFLINTIVTLLAVKLTSKYWGYEILWGSIAIVAIVDNAVRTAVSMGGKLLLGMPTVFYADEAISAIVMVMLVRKMSTSQSLNQAIQITMTTKVFTIVAGSFFVTMFLQLFS
jgi:hypothetical protein